MQGPLKLLRGTCLWIVAGAMASSALADTIYLKNGRKILALSVTEEGDKIHYETSAGTLTLPKSIVDHIVKGGPMPTATGGPEAAAQLAITPPPVEAPSGSQVEVDSNVVHDGAVDRTYISGLEAKARSGNADDAIRAALAHHSAAQFAASQNDLNRALEDERTALTYVPDNPALLMNVAYYHLRRSEYKQSLDYLERARRVAPNNADVAKLAGWAYYGLNNLKNAVAEWKRAQALHPDAEVSAALEKAERDQQEEDSYKENESAHFTLRYSGNAEPGLARDVLRTLEMQYSAVESELSFTTPDPIGVILYTQQAFADITRAPGWVGALNDGRIRVPVQGLTSMTPELSRVLKHELTHSFVQQKTRGRAPVWLQEGLAQWMEGKRSDQQAHALEQIYENRQMPSLAQLEGSWMRLNGDQASLAYAWGLANVEAIIQSGGMSDINRILDGIASGQASEAAVKSVLRSDYNDLMQSTVAYLKGH